MLYQYDKDNILKETSVNCLFRRAYVSIISVFKH